jgi:hypothetical protein
MVEDKVSSLKNRHLQLMALGGAIGAGFFSGLWNSYQPGRPGASDYLSPGWRNDLSRHAGSIEQAKDSVSLRDALRRRFDARGCSELFDSRQDLRLSAFGLRLDRALGLDRYHALPFQLLANAFEKLDLRGELPTAGRSLHELGNHSVDRSGLLAYCNEWHNTSRLLRHHVVAGHFGHGLLRKGLQAARDD